MRLIVYSYHEDNYRSFDCLAAATYAQDDRPFFNAQDDGMRGFHPAFVDPKCPGKLRMTSPIDEKYVRDGTLEVVA